MSQDAVEHYLSEYQRLHGDNADWLNEHRNSALDTFNQQGFPSTRHEAWKYTDVRGLLKHRFVVADPAAKELDGTKLDSVRFSELDCHELVFINGHYSAAHSTVNEFDNGIVMTSLSCADEALREEVQQQLGAHSTMEKHGFAALNNAFVTDGAVIQVPANIEVEKPIHLVFFTDSEDSALISHPRNLVHLGANARATVIESYAGANGRDYCTNTISEVSTAEGAHLEHYKLQHEGDSAFHIGYFHASCDKDSRVESHSISLGGLLVRNDIDAKLVGKGSYIGMNGLYLTNDKQHVDNHTRVDHQVPNTSSDEVYRGVLNGKSRAVFNGKVVVHKDAQQTDANQSNANLLLSNDAEIDTKPELEIYADDVKCSHGATVGQLDENMLFYLRSRAVDESTARSLLTFAFADEVIKRIKFAPVRERLEYTVAGRLPDASLIKEFMQ